MGGATPESGDRVVLEPVDEIVGVLVAEDNHDLRDAMCTLIAAEAGLCVAGMVARVPELVAAMRDGAPRVLVLDLDLDGESSVPALLSLRAQHPQLAVVIFSGSEREALAPVLERIGRCEYVLKTGAVLPLLDAIRRAARPCDAEATAAYPDG
jgi:DNA-binding NarL/FixJ family response regulator